MVEKTLVRIAAIFLILAPLFGCTYFTYKAIPGGDHKGTFDYSISNIYTATSMLFCIVICRLRMYFSFN